MRGESGAFARDATRSRDASDWAAAMLLARTLATGACVTAAEAIAAGERGCGVPSAALLLLLAPLQQVLCQGRWTAANAPRCSYRSSRQPFGCHQVDGRVEQQVERRAVGQLCSRKSPQRKMTAQAALIKRHKQAGQTLKPQLAGWSSGEKARRASFRQSCEGDSSKSRLDDDRKAPHARRTNKAKRLCR